MKNLSLTKEPRCRGADPKTLATCGRRDACARHRQLARDRDLQIPEYVPVRTMTIGYVPGNECSYFKPEAA